MIINMFLFLQKIYDVVFKARFGALRDTKLHTAATHHPFNFGLYAKTYLECATMVTLMSDFSLYSYTTHELPSVHTSLW